MNQNKTVTLEDCFIYNQKMDLMTGENQNWCNTRKQLCDTNYIVNIYSSPNVMTSI